MGFFSTELAVEADSDSLMLRMKARNNNSFICTKRKCSSLRVTCVIMEMCDYWAEVFLPKKLKNDHFFNF